jgi:transposase InsO family protein
VAQTLSNSFSIKQICSQLKISKSAYYSYQKGKTYQPSARKRLLLEAVKNIFDTHKSRYGSRRIKEVLKDKGYKVGLYQVKSLMRAQNLLAIQPKSFVPKTTQSNPSLRRSPNLLLEKEDLPTQPNEVIVGDITYLPSIKNGTNEWLYLATWMDLYSRKIVGWQVDQHMEASLIIAPMKRLIRDRMPEEGLIIHSDGGGQYGSTDFRELLDLYHFDQSMTRNENHYDNAFAESLFSRFKAELLNGGKFYGLEDAQLKIFEYIEGYYNTIRKHSSIGYLSPNQFELKYWSEMDLSLGTKL